MQIARQRGGAEGNFDFLDPMRGERDEVPIAFVLARAQREIDRIVIFMDRALRHRIKARGGEVIAPRGDGMPLGLGLACQSLALLRDTPHFAGDVGEFLDRIAHRADIAGAFHADGAEHLLGHRPVEIRAAGADQPIVEPGLLAHPFGVRHEISYCTLCARGG